MRSQSGQSTCARDSRHLDTRRNHHVYLHARPNGRGGARALKRPAGCRAHDGELTMGCCHADFAAVEQSDRGFTLGMPTFTFGGGVLAEAGDNARELGLKRVALFTDRNLVSGEHVAKVKTSLAAAGVDAVVYDEVAIEPTDASLHQATRFARDANVDGYVSVGG